MVEKLLRCTHCNEIIPPVDSVGEIDESSPLSYVEWSSEDVDRGKEFFLRHEGHPLEELTVDPETFVSDKPCYEPIKTSYVEATNGTRRFVIKRTRTSLDRPVSYELVPGKSRVSDVAPEIREEDPLDDTTWMTEGFRLPEDNVRTLAEAFRGEEAGRPEEDLAAAIERILSGEKPLLPFGRFSELLGDKAFQRWENNLQSSELNVIREFIREQRRAHEPAAIQIGKNAPVSAPRA